MAAIQRRKVFYIPGYDPMPPRRYRELYRTEGAAQAGISGYQLHLHAAAQGQRRFGWGATGQIQGQTTVAEFEVLHWADLVKASMTMGVIKTYGLMLRTAWVYIGSGALWRLVKLRKGPVIAALYPIVILLLQLLVGLLLAWGVYAMLAWVIGPWALGPAFAMLWAVLHGFKAVDGKVFAYYLMQDYAYSAQYWGENPPELERRMAEFTASIRDALDQGYDEVLVVGHSSGAHLAVSILADLCRGGGVPKGAKLGFLSLGHVIPMVGFLPRAWRLRADVQYLSGVDSITWVDVTAPGDGCTFALVDPAAVCGVAPDVQTGPLVISAAFSQTLSPAKWAALRRRYFRLHFQYLCAFDQPQGYDYFQITAGPVSLQARFAGRAESPSCLRVPLSKYTTMAP